MRNPLGHSRRWYLVGKKVLAVKGGIGAAGVHRREVFEGFQCGNRGARGSWGNKGTRGCSPGSESKKGPARQGRRRTPSDGRGGARAELAVRELERPSGLLNLAVDAWRCCGAAQEVREA